MADTDRGFVSQYSQADVGITVIVGSNPTNADGPVTVTVTNEDTLATIFTRTATLGEIGQYLITLSPDDTAVMGNYRAVWSYQVAGEENTFVAEYAVGGAQPAYDALPADLKGLADAVWVRISDLFDSPSGGPNLQTWAQTNFNRGRVAQLMRIAVGRLNTMAQPNSTYTIDGTDAFPTARWGPLLEQLTWIEVIKHLRRSYLEQPDFQSGTSITRLDRQQYFDRWGQVLEEEQEAVKGQLDSFKISQMMLGRPAILVSGGVYGRYSNLNRAYPSGRPRMWFAAYVG